MEGDNGIWVSGGVVLKLVDFSHGVFCGGSLLCGNGAKRGEHPAVNDAAVVEETAQYFLC